MLELLPALLAFATQGMVDVRDKEYDALKVETELYVRATQRMQGPPPQKRNGAVYGAWRVIVEKDSMTDAQFVAVETTSASGGNLQARCSDDGQFELQYSSARRVITTDGIARYQFRIDRMPSIDWQGRVSRDRSAVMMGVGELEGMTGGKTGENGEKSISVIHQMWGGFKILVRIDPDVGEAFEASFSLNGFAKASGVLDCLS